MAEELNRENAKQLMKTIGRTVFDYVKNKGELTAQEWITDYLEEKIPDRSAEEIQQNMQIISDMIDQQTSDFQSMREYLKSGKTSESWLLQKMENSGLSVGEQAKKMTEFLLAVQNPDMDITDIPESQWDDSNWNRYKLKDLAAEVVQYVSASSIESMNLPVQYAESETVESQQCLEADEVLNSEKKKNLKLIIAGGLQLAEALDIIPETSPEEKALTTGVAVDHLEVFAKVAQGKMTLSEGMKEIQTQMLAVLGTTFGKAVSLGAGVAAGVLFQNDKIGIIVCETVDKLFSQKIGAAMVKVNQKIVSVAKQGFNRLKDSLKNSLQRTLNFS